MGLKYIQDMSYLIIAGLRHILSSHLIVFFIDLCFCAGELTKYKLKLSFIYLVIIYIFF